MPSARSSRNFYGWETTGGSAPLKSPWAFAVPELRTHLWSLEACVGKENANQSSWLRVLCPSHQSLHNCYCNSKALWSPTCNHLKLKAQLNYLKCFLKAKNICGLRQLCNLQEREECLALCCCGGRFCCPFLGQAGRKRWSPQEKRGGKGIVFCLVTHMPWLTVTDRRDK